MAKKGSGVASSVLYIGQIPYDWDESVVKSVVCGSGKVVEVRLGFDYVGKNKGFCFVEYQTKQDAYRAIQLLNQVKLVNGGQVKKLRIESSKEGFLKLSAPLEQKPVLQLDRSKLPNYVVLPPEMNGGVGGTPPVGFGQMGYQMNQPSMSHAPAPAAPAITPLVPLKFPPAPPQLPFAVPDKINETLSKIPPAQLIEFISTLKNIVSGPEAARAFEVFQLSPHLASTAAQALLLMGFVDEDVISDAMKTAAAPSPAPAPVPQQPFQPAYGQTFAQATLKWPHLPPRTQAKLTAMPADQAELIAQVLSLPADQISSLPSDKQRMVTDLRAQYL
ncbi:uncharacterized protein CANTADRAFT_90700 [Suhomyces tanzawaensis NRRL Y-17324]|uniref:RRM domain-containing protein n=1 Tax=Suhomyces tanzawaensis NRRL Y-17324 TaxID=984487 RepID=A0A1E4SFR8_9ASCO|nr:uncharacterized protein CANTADRAFT_90700 [Suhomyces tanzawaensis NRRL Y-17324]ODV78351.1 hypothetical protein CANTADRAFT_90700 [Suhomyces tanzawaensis NRRL Y-17324]